MKTFQQLRRRIGQRKTMTVGPARADENRSALQDGLQQSANAHRHAETPTGALPADVTQGLASEQGKGSALPADERSYLEPRIGVGLGEVRIHSDDIAARMAGRLSAHAFTSGSDVYFNAGQYRPGTVEGRYLLAHELAHVAQQRHGVRPDGVTGHVGDAHERNADRAAGDVIQGDSAAGLLSAARVATPASAPPVVQRYAVVAGQPYDRLADDGKMAVKDHGREAWAESGNIANSNKVLDGLHSKVKIEELSGKASKVTLKKFRAVDRAGGTEASLVDDCGGANQQVLGAETAGYASFVGVNKRGSTEEYTSPSSYHGDDNAKGGIVSTTEQMSGEIYIRIFEREFKKKLSREDALKEWAKLSVSEQDRLSKKYGINQYAVPKVGQGVTIGSERDMPGASVGVNEYNFHFGFNLMASGHDYITLEDYAKSGVKYYFDMYGPESKGQSWAQESSNVNAVDDKFTVMVVQHPESLKGTVNAEGAHLEADPASPTGKVKLAKGTQVTILRKGVNWMKVEVKSGPQAGSAGWILNRYFSGT